MVDPYIAATIYAFFTIVVALFQIALMLGAPWGHLAMGGKFPGRFPLKMRIAALIQALILTLLALIVLTRAGTILPAYYAFSNTAIWVVVGISATSLIMNLITPSKWERVLWAPVASILLACSAYIALS